MGALANMSKCVAFLLILLNSMQSFLCQDDLLQYVRLRDDLLVKQKYNKNSRPVKSHLTQTNVSFTMFVRLLSDVDIKTQTFQISGPLILQWTDEHLKWSPADYGGIDSMYFGAEDLWTPDIRSYSTIGGANGDSSVSAMAPRVFATGRVLMWTTSAFHGQCRVNLKDFPFDTMTCSVVWISWTYDITQVNLTGAAKDYSKQLYGPYRKNSEWQVMSKKFYPNRLNHSSVGWWPSMRAKFVLKRRNSIYMYKVGLPYATACLFGFASFLVAAGSLRRYFFAFSSLVILSLIQVTLGLEFGNHSMSVPYALKCISVNMVTLTVSLVVSTLLLLTVNWLAVFCPPLPRSVVTLLDTSGLLGKIFCLSDTRDASIKAANGSDGSTDGDGVETGLDANPFIMDGSGTAAKEWAILAQFIDRLCFAAYIVATIAYHS